MNCKTQRCNSCDQQGCLQLAVKSSSAAESMHRVPRMVAVTLYRFTAGLYELQDPKVQ